MASMQNIEDAVGEDQRARQCRNARMQIVAADDLAQEREGQLGGHRAATKPSLAATLKARYAAFKKRTASRPGWKATPPIRYASRLA